jgi:hypothetical protein
LQIIRAYNCRPFPNLGRREEEKLSKWDGGEIRKNNRGIEYDKIHYMYA